LGDIEFGFDEAFGVAGRAADEGHKVEGSCGVLPAVGRREVLVDKGAKRIPVQESITEVLTVVLGGTLGEVCCWVEEPKGDAF
jgi:hypothetical protein